MSTLTGIEWTDATWNPIRGCSRVSEGCRNCYAEAIAARFSRAGSEESERPPAPFHGFAEMTPAGPRWTGRVELLCHKLQEPLSWRKPRRVFVNSMSDLFHEALSEEDIGDVFSVMALASRHTFQVLTKRPERMWALVPTFAAKHTAADGSGWPLPNVWLGTSIENADYAGRADHLRETPAAVRFLSLEPLLGPLDSLDLTGISWVIVGGESGPRARPCDIAWIRSIVRQCKAAGVPCFVKQVGRWILGDHAGFGCVQQWLLPDGHVFVPPIIGPRAWVRPEDAIGFSLSDRKGGDPEAWPEDLRVREFPKEVR